MLPPIPSKRFAIFATAIGDCAVAWNRRGILSLLLPERTREALRSRIRERFPDARESAPDRRAVQAIRGIMTLLEGQVTDLSKIELDMQDIPPFHQRVYGVARSIGFGQTLSYGEVAARLGCPNAARAVGQALGRNPFALIVPCHRVLAASGKLTGFSAYGGVSTKQRLLELERAKLVATNSSHALARSARRRAARQLPELPSAAAHA